MNRVLLLRAPVTSEVYDVVELDDAGHFIVEANRAETTERILAHLRAAG